MLAYVFWHWRNPRIERAAYQEHLVDFHRTLGMHRPQGFHYSTVFQIERVPWTGGEAEAYEEWYVLENSAALDPLNEAAVSGACKEPHEQIARRAASGSGGLYGLRLGEPSFATTRLALWFVKPSGMTYEALYNTLAPQIKQAGGYLWERQMTLGPAPEFCWHSPTDEALPDTFASLKVPVSIIWKG